MKSRLLAPILLGLFLPLVLGTFSQCWAGNETWDLGVLATVNGQPIKRAAVEQVLKLALPESDGYELKSPAAGQVLEQLILESATQNHIKVSPEDIDRAWANFSLGQAGLIWADSEQRAIKKVLAKQIIVRRLTEKIMLEGQVLSVKEWQKFWAGWPKVKVPRYQVQVLLIPLTVEVSKLELNLFENLENMDSYFMEQSIVALLSGPMWLVGADQDPALVVALDEAFASGKPTEAWPLKESWAIYQVLKMERESAPLADYRLAKDTFEALAREKAFRNWLAEKRAQADIKIAPFGN